MMLHCPKLDIHMKIVDSGINMLVLENEHIFEHFCLSFMSTFNKESEDIIIEDMESDKSISINKVAEIISSPFDIEYNDKKIQKVLYELLAEDTELSDINEKLIEKFSEILELLDELSLSSDFELDHVDNITINDILKEMKISIKQPDGPFVYRLLEYIKNESVLLNKNLFVLINCCSFISSDEFEEIEKFSNYYDIKFLFIENTPKVLKNKQNLYIVDKDMCNIF